VPPYVADLHSSKRERGLKTNQIVLNGLSVHDGIGIH
jgi:hypothetical protein